MCVCRAKLFDNLIAPQSFEHSRRLRPTGLGRASSGATQNLLLLPTFPGRSSGSQTLAPGERWDTAAQVTQIQPTDSGTEVTPGYLKRPAPDRGYASAQFEIIRIDALCDGVT